MHHTITNGQDPFSETPCDVVKLGWTAPGCSKSSDICTLQNDFEIPQADEVKNERNFLNQGRQVMHEQRCTGTDQQFCDWPMQKVHMEYFKLQDLDVIDEGSDLILSDVEVHLYKDIFSGAILPPYISFRPFDYTAFACSLYGVFYGHHLAIHNCETNWYVPGSIKNLCINHYVKITKDIIYALYAIGGRLTCLPKGHDHYLLNIFKKIQCGASEKAKKNKITLDALVRLIYRIIGIYNHSYQSRLMGAPCDVFRAALKNSPIAEAPDLNYFQRIFSIKALRPFTKNGIEFKGISYSSPEMKAEFAQHPPPTVGVEILPWDLSQIFVYGENGQIIGVADKIHYTKGLSLDRHEATLNAFRKKWKRQSDFVRIEVPLQSILENIRRDNPQL